MLQKMAGHVIGPMGVEHYGQTFSFNGYSRVPGFSELDPILLHEIDPTARDEKLGKSPWIRKEGSDNTPSALASNQESIRPVSKIRDPDSIEKPEAVTVLTASSHHGALFLLFSALGAYPIPTFL